VIFASFSLNWPIGYTTCERWGRLSPKAKKRIANETLDIYAPIATRLGMNEVRMEFEDLGLRTLYPMRARRLEAAREAARGRRKQLIEDITEQLEQALKRDNIEGRVAGREKHLYSIYSKMREKRKSFSGHHGYFCLSSHRRRRRCLLSGAGRCALPIQAGSLANLKTTLPFPKPMAISPSTLF
jgi:hypothetical protein